MAKEYQARPDCPAGCDEVLRRRMKRAQRGARYSCASAGMAPVRVPGVAPTWHGRTNSSTGAAFQPLSAWEPHQCWSLLF